MKAFLILLNFSMSFIGLCIKATNGSIIVPIIGAAWFFSACYILTRAHRNGTMDRVNEIMKLNEL